MARILFILLLGLFSRSFAISISVDSSLVLLERTRYSHPDSTFNTLESLKSRDLTQKQQALINEFQGDIHWYKGDYESSVASYQLNLDIYSELKDTLIIGHTLGDIGYIFMEMKRYSKALEYYQRAFEIAVKFNDEKLVYLSTTYKGQLNEKLGHYNEALAAYKEALTYNVEEENESRNIAIIYNNMANLYLNDMKYDSALIYAEKSNNILRKIDDKNSKANYNAIVGSIYRYMGKYELAEKHLLVAEKLNIELGKKAYLGEVYFELIMAYVSQGKLNKADEYVYMLNEIVNKAINLRLKAKYCSAKKNIFESKQIYDSAYYYSELEKLFDDSVLNLKKQEQIMILSEEFDSKKKENDIRLLKTEHERDLLVIERRNIQLIYSVCGGIIFLILTVLAYKGFKDKKAANEIIAETNEELNQTNEELAAQRDEIESQKNKIETAHKEIRDSIVYAKRIQDAILPSMEAMNKALKDGFVLYQPKDVVAGDFYWMEQFQNRVYVAAADCTGHGVPGAMVSVVCSNALSKAVLEDNLIDVDKILNRTREIVIDKLTKSGEVKDGMDISMACFDFKNMKLEWAGANNPLYLLRNGTIQITRGDRQPIGATENPTPFAKHIFDIQSGDIVYLFTDGYPDQFGGKMGKKMSNKKFREKLIEVSSAEMEKQKEFLAEYFAEWKGAEEQLDDVCVIGIKI